MSLLLFAAKGFALGFAVAAPLGPIGALCINRTLQRGFWVGLSGGLGTALAESGDARAAEAAYQRGLEVARVRGDKQVEKEIGVFLRRLARSRE